MKNNKTPTSARDIILLKLAEMPAKECLDHPALLTLLALDELKPALQGVAMLVAASSSATEARNQARFEAEQAEAARAAAHQAEMDAVALAERRLNLQEREERLEADRIERAERSARRTNGHGHA